MDTLSLSAVSIPTSQQQLAMFPQELMWMEMIQISELVIEKMVIQLA